MSRLVLAASLLVVTFSSIQASVDVAEVGDSFNLTVPAQCAQDEQLTLFHLLADGTAVILARRDAGVWTLTSRMRYEEPDLVLAPINYNDRGLYEFTWTGFEDRIHLEVVDPRKFSVFENHTVHLPCHAVTVGEDVGAVRWEKWEAEGEVVVSVDLTSQKVTYGAGFSWSASVPPDWFSKGDFTLTLGRAQLRDQGVYICYIQDKHGKSRRDPAAARLMVQRMQSQTSNPQPGPPISKAQNGQHAACVVISILLLVLCPVAFGVAWWIRSYRSAPSASSPAPGPEAGEAQLDVTMPLVSVNNVVVQANGHR